MNEGSYSLSIVGAGRVGQTLALLLRAAAGVVIQQVCNRSAESAQHAVSFIGDGEVVTDLRQMRSARVWMISVADTEIRPVAEGLAEGSVIREGDVVFHCSGALPADELSPLRRRGAYVASLHPIRSFAEPVLAVRKFPGTWCALEGDRSACELLHHLLDSIGAHVLLLTAEAKRICHIGHVFASNYVVTMLDAAQQLYRAAGVEEAVITQFLRPIVQSAVDNVLALGPTAALTGPVKRGDAAVIEDHFDALTRISAELTALYCEAARSTLTIAQRGGLIEEKARVIHRLLTHTRRSCQES